MRIFLVGFMGCGKSTLGHKLAARLDWQFIELDAEFEKQEGVTIAKYFSEKGEGDFRRKESQLLKTLTMAQDCIISTGGGLPCFHDNMLWMKDAGKVIYIQLAPKTLADRLAHRKENRPLLHDKDGDSLVDFIAEKLAEREPYYLQANIVVNGLSLTAEKLANVIFQPK